MSNPIKQFLNSWIIPFYTIVTIIGGTVYMLLGETAEGEVTHSHLYQVGDSPCINGKRVLVEGVYGPAKTKDPSYDVWDGKIIGLRKESQMAPCLNTRGF